MLIIVHNGIIIYLTNAKSLINVHWNCWYLDSQNQTKLSFTYNQL